MDRPSDIELEKKMEIEIPTKHEQDRSMEELYTAVIRKRTLQDYNIKINYS